MLIDLMRRRSARILVQFGAVAAAGAAIVGPLLLPEPAGFLVAAVAVASLLLIVVKGLLVVAVAVATTNRTPAVPTPTSPPWDEREVRELRRLLDRFFDEEDPTHAGRIERLTRLVEPVVAAHSVQGQQLVALQERLDRLERIGPE